MSSFSSSLFSKVIVSPHLTETCSQKHLPSAIYSPVRLKLGGSPLQEFCLLNLGLLGELNGLGKDSQGDEELRGAILRLPSKEHRGPASGWVFNT